MLHVFRNIRMHHSAYTKDAKSPSACLDFYHLWSNPARWAAEMIAPSMADGLGSKVMARLRLVTALSNVAAPMGAIQPPDAEDEKVFLHHIRLVFDMVDQMLAFAIEPQSPPWSFCQLLHHDAGVQKDAVTQLKSLWSLVVRLECSGDPIHQEMMAKLPILRWVVFREPLLLLEASGWDVERPMGVAACRYVRAMFSGVQHTLALENTFNDLRDNEGRGARHKARSEQVLQGLSLSSMKSRYDHCPLVEVGAEDVAGQSMRHVRPDTFIAAKAPTTESSIGFEAASLVHNRSAWPSTSTHEFSNTQLGLLNVLMVSNEAHWSNLWLAMLFQRHTVVSSTSSGAFYYVVSSRPHSISLLKLRPTDDDHLWTMRPCSDDLLMWETVDTMESYICHEYTLELKYGTRGPTVAVRVKSVGGESLKRFCCMHFLENFPLYVLKALANAVGLVLPRTAKHIRYAEALLDHCEIDGNAKDDVMSRVDKKLAKRSKRKSKAASSDGAEEDAVGGEDANESAKEEVVLDNPFVRSLPEAEVAFAFNEIPAGHALDDEENDEGLDEIAAAAEGAAAPKATPSPAKKASKVASSGAFVGGSSSSSSGMLPPSDLPPLAAAAASSSSSSSAMPPPSDLPPLAAAAASPMSPSGQPPLPPPIDLPQPAAAPIAPLAVQTPAAAPMAPLAAHVRLPNLGEEDAPPGCPPVRLYPGAKGMNTFRWQAKLPPGAGPFEGTYSKSASFQQGESGDRAKLICVSYLRRWWATQQ